MERLPRPQGSLSSGGVAGPEWRGLAPTSFMHSKALWGQGWPGPRGGRGSTCSSPSVRSPSVMDKSPPACARSSSRCSVPADRSCVPHRLRLPTCLTGAGGEGTPESSCSPCCWPSPWSPHRIPHPSPRHTRCPGGLNRPLPRCPGPHLRPAQRLAWPGLAPGAGGGDAHEKPAGGGGTRTEAKLRGLRHGAPQDLEHALPLVIARTHTTKLVHRILSGRQRQRRVTDDGRGG